MPKDRGDKDERFPYALKITAKTKIFEAIAYLKKANSLDLISDGRSKRLGYVYNAQQPQRPSKVDYFIYLPTAHNLELQLNT